MQAQNVIRYWALKTRDLTDGQERDYWNSFLKERVVAIGWPGIDVRPDAVDFLDLVASLRRTHEYSERRAIAAADMIRKFIEIGIGDNLLICQGYAPNQRAEVYLYGIARVDGPFYNDRISNWWRFKHMATIQSIGEYGLNVPKSLLVETLQKESLLRALHEIDREGFETLTTELRRRYGINVSI